jgi:hypothetical protein
VAILECLIGRVNIGLMTPSLNGVVVILKQKRKERIRVNSMNKITVEEYLLKHTEVGDLVEFTSGGWRIGITYIDSEDLFIQSLNKNLLNAKVKYENKDKKLYIGDYRNPTIIEVSKSIEVKY